MKKWLVCLIATCLFAVGARAWPVHGQANNWNGGLVQTGPWTNSFNGEYPFLNNALNSGSWVSDDPGDPVADINTTNQYGFPTTATTFGEYQTLTQLPTQAQRSGNYIIDWYSASGGSATVSIQGTNVSVSGAGCTQTGTTVAGQAGVKYSGVNCQGTFTPLSTGEAVWRITAVTSDDLSQVRIYHVNDGTCSDATLLGAQGTSPLSREMFGCQFKAALLAAPFGVIRFMDKENINGTNVATWEDRMPVSFWNYGAYTFPAAELTTNQITNSSGAEYTLTPYAGFSLADKIHIITRGSGSIAPLSTTATADTTLGNTITVASVTNVVAGMLVGDTNQGNGIQQTATVASVNPGASTVTLQCPASTCSNAVGSLNGTYVHNGDTIHFSPMLSVDGGSTYHPLAGTWGSLNNGTISTSWITLTYLNSLGVWSVQTAANNSGIGSANGNWPIEVAIQLCNEINAYPWMPTPPYSFNIGTSKAADSLTDYVSQEATYIKTNLKSSLIPRLEGGPNETWNYIFFATGLFDNYEFLVNGGKNFDHDNAYGEAASLVGQAASTVYGANRSLYKILACFASNEQTVKGSSGNDYKVSSPVWVTEGGSAAYNWITGICDAPYWQSSYFGTIYETGWAYVYSNAVSETLIGDYLAGSTQQTNSNGRINVYNYQNNSSYFPAYTTYLAAWTTAGYTFDWNMYEGGYAAGAGGNGSSGTQNQIVLAVTTGNPTILTIAPSWDGYISQSGGVGTLHVTTNPSVGSITQATPVVCSGCSTFTVTTQNNTCTTSQTCTVGIAQTVGSSGSPVAMTGDNAFDYIINTASLSSPTTTINNVCAELNTNSYTVTAATPTTITINATTDASCTYTSGGSISYNNSGTYQPAFEVAVQIDSQLAAYELEMMQNFHTAGGTFPAFYETTGMGPWSVYYPGIYTSSPPKVTAAQEYDVTPFLLKDDGHRPANDDDVTPMGLNKAA